MKKIVIHSCKQCDFAIQKDGNRCCSLYRGLATLYVDTYIGSVHNDCPIRKEKGILYIVE